MNLIILQVIEKTARYSLTLRSTLASCILFVLFIFTPFCGMASDDPGGPHYDPLASATWHRPYVVSDTMIGNGNVTELEMIQIDDDEFLFLIGKGSDSYVSAHDLYGEKTIPQRLYLPRAGHTALRFVKNAEIPLNVLKSYWPRTWISELYPYAEQVDEANLLDVSIANIEDFYPTIIKDGDSYYYYVMSRQAAGSDSIVARLYRLAENSDVTELLYSFYPEHEAPEIPYSCGSALRLGDNLNATVFNRTWVDQNDDGRNSIYYVECDDEGTVVFGPETQSSSTQDTAWFDWMRDQEVLKDNVGNVYFSYISATLSPPVTRIETCIRSLDGLTKLSQEINVDPQANPAYTSVLDSTGNYHLFWAEADNDSVRILHKRMAANGVFEAIDVDTVMAGSRENHVYPSKIRASTAQDGNSIVVASNLYLSTTSFYKELVGISYFDENVITNINNLGENHRYYEKNDSDRISIFPNPTNDKIQLNFKLKNNSELYRISVYNIEGRLIWSDNLLINQRNSTLSLSSFFKANSTGSGKYFLEVVGGGERYTKSFVIIN